MALLKMFFGRANGVILPLPNMTLDEKESIIIHAPSGAQTTVAIKVNPDGSLRILLSPPSIDKDYIDVKAGQTFPDAIFSSRQKEVE